MSRLSTTLLAVALLVAGCGDDRFDSGQATPATEPTTSSSGPALPGERHEIYPYQGAKLAVVGVAAGDTVKVRSGPGTDSDVVFELPPNGDEPRRHWPQPLARRRRVLV